ncbi:MAG: extracellular solute-binding protein [Planctomycetes bacterium]|nr:extracellular solute-binding protein [Planctomycetota bacterium]
MKFLFLTGLFTAVLLLPSCGGSGHGEVVVYTSLDEVFSGPILDEFKKNTGIDVKILSDTETTKTVGLATRLIEEKEHPMADVFWNNEISWTIVLKQKGLLAPYTSASAADIPDRFKDPEGCWTGFAARARVILYNTNLVKAETAPESVYDLLKPEFRGKVAIAQPIFGTTYTHAAALFACLGEQDAKRFFIKLKENDCRLVSGNFMAAKMTADGEAFACLTDTDDANEMLTAGKPVKMVFPDKNGMGALILPNTIALIKNGPNPENGKKLIDFLLSAGTEQKLARLKSAQMPVRKNIQPYSSIFSLENIRAMVVSYEKIAAQLEPARDFIYSDFLK